MLPLLLLTQTGCLAYLAKSAYFQAELLAGNAQGGGTPEPTRTANIWYSDGTIYLEAQDRPLGGQVALIADPSGAGIALQTWSFESDAD